MLRKLFKYWFIFALLIIPWSAGAQASPETYDPCSGVEGYKGISKVRPGSSRVLKVRPSSGITAGFDAISRFNPLGWGAECCLPMPAQKQFVAGPRVTFARISGEIRTGADITGLATPMVNFDDHLGLPKSGNTVWQILAHYQIQPRWGIRYSFTPISLESTHTPASSFVLKGINFTSNSTIYSKWERWEHRAGVVFDLSRRTSGVTSLFAEWLYIQDKLAVRDALGTSSVTWDEDKSLALLGLEFNKCLKNYRGSTLALSAKGGIAFLHDHVGYDAEAALSYLIPVKRGRFGYLKGGYRYATLKKEKDVERFSTTLDGAFVEVGFLF